MSQYDLDTMWNPRLPSPRSNNFHPAFSRRNQYWSFTQVVNQSRYNKSVDWYALGVLIFEMLSGLPPYHQPEPNPVLLYERIAAGPTYIRWPAFHANAKDLIMKLMESDPSKRFGNLRHGAGDVFAHAWFQEVDWEKLRRREIMAPYMPKIDGDGDASA